jgi:hypothetical protein
VGVTGVILPPPPSLGVHCKLFRSRTRQLELHLVTYWTDTGVAFIAQELQRRGCNPLLRGDQTQAIRRGQIHPQLLQAMV